MTDTELVGILPPACAAKETVCRITRHCSVTCSEAHQQQSTSRTPSGGSELSFRASELVAQLVLLLCGLLQALASGALPQAGLHVALGSRLQLLHCAVLPVQRHLQPLHTLL